MPGAPPKERRERRDVDYLDAGEWLQLRGWVMMLPIGRDGLNRGQTLSKPVAITRGAPRVCADTLQGNRLMSSVFQVWDGPARPYNACTDP